MVTFKEFKDSTSQTPVAVNPDHVAKVLPYADDPDVTIIYLTDGTQFGVEGKYPDVVKKLTQ